MVAKVLRFGLYLFNETLGIRGGFRSDGGFYSADGTLILGVEPTDVYASQDAVLWAARADGTLTVYGGDAVSPIRLAAVFAKHPAAAGHRHGATLAEWLEYTRKDGSSHPLCKGVPADFATTVAAFYGNDED